MSTSFSAQRALAVRSPAIPLVAGRPALVALKLEGTEGVNSLFHYTLTLQTPDASPGTATGSNFDLDRFIGVEITCSIELEGMGSFQPGLPGDRSVTHQGAGVREISGLVTAARFVREDHRHAVYELELRPWLYLTTLTTDCRVFQDQTAVEVIEAVLAPYAYAADKRLIGEHPPKDYCVQFNETTFEFITRLMQERGINYHFEHSDGVHRLIWSDDNTAFRSIQPELPRGTSPYHDIPYYPLGHKIDREYIHRFERTSRLVSGAYATRDHDPTRPIATLDADASAPRQTAHARQAVYLWRGSKAGLGGSDYSQPNAGADKQAHRTEEQGRQLALLRMQNLRQGGLRAHGTGHVRGVVPGRTFTLSGHPHEAANTDYLVLHTRLVVENVDETTQRDGPAPGARALADVHRRSGHWRVTVDFTVQPVRETLRPDFTQPKPRAYGPQPAIVCGPDADTAETNIHTDALGRVKLQFFWDRYGARNQGSSCWVRAQGEWAGNQMGSTHVPRVGQEVIVDFYDGDLDRPVIVGRVHNALNLSAWRLPDQQALSGFRSRELVSGGGNSAAGRSNHLVLDDTAGGMQAQLKSDHQHSQLSLGHITRIEDHQGRKDHRGQGFDLRTDGHGVVRAGDGLLLTTHGRQGAREHMLSMEETTGPLGAAHDQHKRMGDLAVHHRAQDDDEARDVQHSLRQQADDLSGQGHPHQADRHPEMQAPHLALSSPAGIESTTPGSTHAHSGAHHVVTAGRHISLASAGSVLASAGKHLRAFANLGIRMMAAKGKVEIQAQDGDMELLAQKMLELLGREGITLKSDKLIRLVAGGHAIQITPGAGIEFLSPLAPQFHTAAINLATPRSVTEAIQDSPDSRFNETLYLADPDDRPFANRHYELTREDGSVVRGITAADGGIPIQRSDHPERLGIRILGTPTP
ncbi:type VI secretion system tip protein VgrG [Comamonadaceae bacterium OTU4NAUVB1]|nr:type VI secretion system tip protein VgrG [Comamonadaceae bacterium OTU4NAUVB1]